jgi:hypothetical protein
LWTAAWIQSWIVTIAHDRNAMGLNWSRYRRFVSARNSCRPADF